MHAGFWFGIFLCKEHACRFLVCCEYDIVSVAILYQSVLYRSSSLLLAFDCEIMSERVQLALMRAEDKLVKEMSQRAAQQRADIASADSWDLLLGALIHHKLDFASETTTRQPCCRNRANVSVAASIWTPGKEL